MDNLLNKISNLSDLCYKLNSITLLALRLYIFKIFIKSGIDLAEDLRIAELVFTSDFQIPLLSPKVSSLLFTGGEILLPAMLMLGLLGRLPALALFILNLAIIQWQSSLWLGTPESICALHAHGVLGLLLLISITFGAGTISVDKLIQSIKPNYRF